MSEKAPRRRIWRWLLPGLWLLLLAPAWVALFWGGFAGVFAWLMLTSLLPLAGIPALLCTLVYAAVKRRASTPTLLTAALSLLASWPLGWFFGIAPLAYPASVERTGPAATVRLPSDLPLRVLWGGNSVSTNYHAIFPSQRWAYDLGIEPALTGSTEFADYGCWGSVVLAPTNARVHLAHDGEPDVTPGLLTNEEAPLGNFVSLELSSKTYLVIGHLQSGSVVVRAGDDVTEGQLLGRCGNSGHTSEPHIHLHHQREPLNPAYSAVAEGLPLFFRDHGGPPMPEGGLELVGERPVARGVVVRHQGSTVPTGLQAP